MSPGLLFGGLSSGAEGLLSVAGIVMLVWGLVNAFFGYKIFKIVLAVCGFLTGVFIGGVPALLLAGDGSVGLAVLLIPVCGIIGAVLAVVLHKVGVFLSVGAMGFIIFLLLLQNTSIALVLGIVCGIAGVVLEKYAIIISTGLSGGFLAAAGAAFLVELGVAGTVAAGLVIGICGIIVQLGMERKKPAAAVAAGVAAGAAAAARPVPPPAPVRPAGASAAPNRCCPNCGVALTAGSSFCRMCGHMVLSESSEGGTFCVNCGAEMSSTANFCKKCGAARSV